MTLCGPCVAGSVVGRRVSSSPGGRWRPAVADADRHLVGRTCGPTRVVPDTAVAGCRPRSPSATSSWPAAIAEVLTGHAVSVRIGRLQVVENRHRRDGHPRRVRPFWRGDHGLHVGARSRRGWRNRDRPTPGGKSAGHLVPADGCAPHTKRKKPQSTSTFFGAAHDRGGRPDRGGPHGPPGGHLVSDTRAAGRSGWLADGGRQPRPAITTGGRGPRLVTAVSGPVRATRRLRRMVRSTPERPRSNRVPSSSDQASSGVIGVAGNDARLCQVGRALTALVQSAAERTCHGSLQGGRGRSAGRGRSTRPMVTSPRRFSFAPRPRTRGRAPGELIGAGTVPLGKAHCRGPP